MAANKGWIKLHRKLWDNDFLKSPEPYSKREAFVDIILNQARGTVNGSLGRGEFEASQRRLAKRWKWSRSKVRCSSRHAKKTA